MSNGKYFALILRQVPSRRMSRSARLSRPLQVLVRPAHGDADALFEAVHWSRKPRSPALATPMLTKQDAKRERSLLHTGAMRGKRSVVLGVGAKEGGRNRGVQRLGAPGPVVAGRMVGQRKGPAS